MSILFEDFKEYLQTGGGWDSEKIETEVSALLSVEAEASKVYYHVTGGQLSKTNYTADVINTFHDDACTEAYEEGERQWKRRAEWLAAELVKAWDKVLYEDPVPFDNYENQPVLYWLRRAEEECG